MNRPGRILIIDDLEQWREEVSEILQRERYLVASASTAKEALELLDQSMYHILILDIRMDESDQSNEDGINLLSELEKRGLYEETEVIMLSAYGTKERTRTAFKEYQVADFLYKEEFNKQMLLESVRTVFAKKVKINLTLEILWQHGTGPAQALHNLKVEGTSIVQGTALHDQLVTELEDLLCRLFDQAKSILVSPLKEGHSGAGMLRIQPFFTTGGGRAVAVKFGDVRIVEQEYNNFIEYVQPFMGGGRTTTIQEVRRTPHLGGIIYSLLDTAHDPLMDFGEFYRHSDILQIHEALDYLFGDTCSSWYASRGDLEPLNLSKDYEGILTYAPDISQQIRSNQLDVRQVRDQLYFWSLEANRHRPFTNPVTATVGKALVRPTFKCITHGDFHHLNLLIDSTRHVWLIDFQVTAESHILRDVAILDSVVRFQLLMPEEATLEECLEMEEALCSIERFSQVENLAAAFTTQNPALAKTYATVVYLLTWARRLVAMNPDDDISEYYIALLYAALNTIRFSSLEPVQREHALLCASLLADRLGLSTQNQGDANSASPFGAQ